EHMDTPRERIRIDLRVGGRYELTMVQRDGSAEFTIGYEIVELVEPELIVLRSDPMPQVGMHEPTVVRVEFHDHGAKTRMTLSDALDWPAREVAALLDDSVPAVNSALQRARQRITREVEGGTIARLHAPASAEIEAEATGSYRDFKRLDRPPTPLCRGPDAGS